MNSVLPGPTLSEGLETMLEGAARKAGRSIEQAAVTFVEASRPSSIIQGAATTEEVANMVVYVVFSCRLWTTVVGSGPDDGR